MNQPSKPLLPRSERVFSLPQIAFATACCGPLGGFLMISINFAALGHTDKSLPSVRTGFGVTATLALIGSVAPHTPVLVALLAIGFGITMFCACRWQRNMIDALLERSNGLHGMFSVAGMLYLGVVSSFIAVVGALLAPECVVSPECIKGVLFRRF